MRHLAIAALIALTACGNGAKVTSGDLADAATTAYILNNPATYRELNPLVPSDPVAGAAALIGMKYLGKAALIEGGMEPDTANDAVDIWAGWLPAVHNLVFFATNSHPAGLLLGGGVAWYLWENRE